MTGAASCPPPRVWPRLLVPALLLGAVSLPLAAVVYAGRVPIPDYLRYFAPWADGSRPLAAWNALWFDAVGQYWPWRTLLHDSLRHGFLPYWNPYQCSGYAFAGNGQSALFYPFNWLFFGLFPVATGFRLTAVFHLWLAAYGSYRLLRNLGAGRAAGLTAGCGFALSGFLVTWVMLPTLIASAAWLPVALAAIERARAERSWRPGLAAGIAVGLAALAGHPQIFYYVALTVCVVGAVRLGRAGLGPLLAAGVVAGLLAAPTLLPVLDLAPRSHRPPSRSEGGYTAFLGRAVPAERAVALLVPGFYGSPAAGTVNTALPPQAYLQRAKDGFYWGRDRQGAIAPGDYTEFNGYLGVVGWLALAGLLVLSPAWRRSPAGRAALTYGGLAVVALWLSFGTFPNRLLYFHFPGWSAGAGPCRLLLLWCLGGAVTAGLVVQELQTRPAPRRLGLAAGLVAGLAVALAWLASRWLLSQGYDSLLAVTEYRRLTLLAGLVGGLAIAAAVLAWRPRWTPLVVLADLAWFGWGFNPSCEPELLDPQPPAVAALRDRLAAAGTRVLVRDSKRQWSFYRPPDGLLLPPNLATAAGLRDVGGYDSLLPAHTKQRLYEAAGRHQPSPATNGNMLLLGEVEPTRLWDAVGAVVVPRRAGGVLPTAPPPRPARSRCWRWAPGRGLEEQVGAIVLDRPNRVTLTVPAWSTWLLDSADPGWRCYVGQPTGPLTAVAWLRPPFRPPCELGRWVPLHGPLAGLTGPVRVQWVYQPTPLRVGLFAGLCGLALLAGLGVAGRQQRRGAAGPRVEGD